MGAWGKNLAGVLATGLFVLGGCQDSSSAGQDEADASTGGEDSQGSSAAATEADAGSDSSADTEDPTGAGDAPTWHQDVAPVVVGRCAGCHRPGGIGPLAFDTYDAASPVAEAIALVTESGSMPPFGADDTDECTHPMGFKEDLRLSDDEKAMLRAWADAGAPEGDPELAAEIPEPVSTQLDPVDQTLIMPTQVTIDGAQDQFLCFSLDPGLSEDAFLKAIQVVPGNDKIVHHVLIYVDEDGSSADQAGAQGYFPCSGGSIGGDLVGAWAPGVLPMRMPEDTGMKVPAGSRLVMNVHYHPTGVGAEVDDASGIEIDWHEERPAWAAQLALIGNSNGSELLPGPNDEGGKQFMIPAGAKNHTEEMIFEIPSDLPELKLWQVGAHMHYVGVDMLIGVQRDGGSETECLLQTPNYDFQWQRGYVYDGTLSEVPKIYGGDQVYLRCTYDNSMDNPKVVQALAEQGLTEPVDVYLGEETLDEMCLGVFGVAFPNVL